MKIVFLFLLLFSIISAVSAQVVSIGDHSTFVDSEITVAINISDAELIAGGVVNISFDPSIVSVKTAEAGDFGDSAANINNMSGSFKLVSADYKAVNKSEAVLANIVFRGLSNGQTRVDITQTSLNNEKGELIYPLIVNGSIYVGMSPPIPVCGPDKLKCENVGSPVKFDASASYDPDGTIISYEWDFGDGKNGTGVLPVHTYTTHNWNSGAYQPFMVNLKVTDNSGLTNSTSQKVVIWIPGDANGDGTVNIIDASIIGFKWNTADPCADLNNDGKVNIIDASIIGFNWNKKAQ